MLRPKRISVGVRTAMLRNRLGYPARVALPYFASAGFAQVYDLAAFEARVIGTRVTEARVTGARVTGTRVIGTRVVGTRVVGTRVFGSSQS